MMSNGYALSSCVFDFCTKPFVAKVTGRHLYACVVLLCIFPGAEVFDGERNGTPPAQFSDEEFISVGFVATQIEVAVNGLHAVSLVEHHHQ